MPKITAVETAVQDYLSVRQLAEKFEIHYSTALKMCLAGKVGVRVGRRWRILPSELAKVAGGPWSDVKAAEGAADGRGAK